MDATLTKKEKQAIKEYLASKGLPMDRAVTFADVSLREAYSDIRSRSEINDFSATLARDFTLNIPIISANMEPVTGVELAAALAREGGVGCVPQMPPLDDRLDMIERIRRYDSALIEDPLTASPGNTLKEAKRIMAEFDVSGLIVVDENRKPVGVLSTRDWRYARDDGLKISELMTREVKTLPKAKTTFEDAAEWFRKTRLEKLPLVDEDGKLAGLITARGLFYDMHYPRALRDKEGRFLVVGSVGVGREFTKEKLAEIAEQLEAGAGAILVDTARATSVNAGELLDAVRGEFPEVPLVVGNVSTAEGAKFLFEHGADAVKVNQGRGHVCSTSEVGIGNPQLTAIAEASVVARQYNGRIVADGGMHTPGDMVKAIAAGADTAMTGYLLIGTYESAAPLKMNKQGLPVKTYYGSASFEAQKQRLKKGTLGHMRRPEGVSRDVPVVGSLADKVDDMVNVFRSAMSYLGVRNLDELREQAQFTPQTREGYVEGVKEKAGAEGATS